MVAMTRVSDIMQREVVTVGADATVRDLIDLLTSRRVTGVPVVDRGGHVLGVVSAHDVLRLVARQLRRTLRPARGAGTPRAAEPEPPRDPRRARLEYFLAPDTDVSLRQFESRVVNGTLVGRTRVREIMTPAIFRVRAEATLPELARFLSRAGIHRALVMRRGQLAGLVTTMDVVRAIAEETGAEAGAADRNGPVSAVRSAAG